MFGKFATVAVGFILLQVVAPECLQSCVSDMQCKGFTAVNELVYCWKNCCSSANTVVGDSRFPLNCDGGIELWTNSDASQYPWLGYMVMQNASACTYCMVTLLSSEWIVTDFSCFVPIQNSVNDAINVIYFYYDDPYKRQVYNATAVYSGPGMPRAVSYIQIQYIGFTPQIPLTPPPINCDTTLAPGSATLFYWNLSSPLGTRTFTTYPVQLQTPSFCSSTIASQPGFTIYPDDYFCIKGVADNDFFEQEVVRLFQGGPIMLQQSSGDWLYLGSGMNARQIFPSYSGNMTILVNAAFPMNSSPSWQSLFGAVCAA